MTETVLPTIPALRCEAVTCHSKATHLPCCSAHKRALCCTHYCRTHFVEVDQCKPEDHQ